LHEKELYEKVKIDLVSNFTSKFNNCFLEITSDGKFPEDILSKVGEYYDIIFSFLKKKNSPDLTGFIKTDNRTDFITVEIKNDTLTLEDVYQAKRYAELFQAKFGFLISTKPIPTALKRLCNKIQILFIAGTGYEKLKLATFDIEANKIVADSWFPESPFK